MTKTSSFSICTQNPADTPRDRLTLLSEANLGRNHGESGKSTRAIYPVEWRLLPDD